VERVAVIEALHLPTTSGEVRLADGFIYDLACTGFMAILNEMPSHEEWLSYVITDNQ
jgi:hypothetical protein